MKLDKSFVAEMAAEFFKRALEAETVRVRDFFLKNAVDTMTSAGVEIAYIKNAAAQLGIK